MLDEYILNQLDELEEEYRKLNQILDELNTQEKVDQNKIDTILNTKDIGFEIFSPRANSGKTKEEVAEIQKHLDDVRLQQVETMEQISHNREKEEKYQLMLNEVRMKNIEDERSMKTEISNIPLWTTHDAGQAEESTKIKVENAISNPIGQKVTEKPAITEEERQNIREDYMEILQRVEKCINLINHDRSKCKSELKNLRYYLKALLSK